VKVDKQGFSAPKVSPVLREQFSESAILSLFPQRLLLAHARNDEKLQGNVGFILRYYLKVILNRESCPPSKALKKRK